MSLNDAFYEGQPRTALTPKHVDAVQQMITLDHYGNIWLNWIFQRPQSIEFYMIIRSWIKYIHIGFHTIYLKLKNILVSIGAGNILKNLISCASKHICDIISNVTKIEFLPRNLQHNKNWLFRYFKINKLQRSCSCTKCVIEDIDLFLQMENVRTAVLGDRRTINGNWYMAVYLLEINAELRKWNVQRHIAHYQDNTCLYTAIQTFSYLKKEKMIKIIIVLILLN